MSYRNRVQLGDWAAADGDHEIDAHGCEWTLWTVTGWFDSPPIQASPISLVDADGSWDAAPTLGARIIGVTGSVKAPDGPALQAATDRISALLTGADRFGTLIVDETARGLSRQATVRLNDTTLPERLGSRTAKWSLSLYAADPRRYSTDYHTLLTGRYVPAVGASWPLTFPVDFGGLGSGGIVRSTNRGEQPTPVLMYLYGPLTNPTVRWVEGNRTISPRMTLAAGQTLAIDTALPTPSIRLGSSSRRQSTSPAEFFRLPPGDSTLYLGADNGTGTMAVFWRDAW